MTGFRMGLIASAAAAALAAPMGPALAGTTIYDEDNFSVGDNGIDVTVSGYGSYSGYPISGQVLQITVNGGAPYTVISWCIDFNHNINVPGTYTDYQLVPFTPAGLMSVSTELNTPEPAALADGSAASQTTINEINFLMDLGNTLLAHANTSTANDVNSAIQIAIWQELYGSAMSYTGASSAVMNDVTDYLAEASANDGYKWPGVAVISAGGEQQLAYGVGAVPEPATWALMLLGFAGLGFAGYRKAKAGQTAPSAA